MKGFKVAPRGAAGGGRPWASTSPITFHIYPYIQLLNLEIAGKLIHQMIFQSSEYDEKSIESTDVVFI